MLVFFSQYTSIPVPRLRASPLEFMFHDHVTDDLCPNPVQGEPGISPTLADVSPDDNPDPSTPDSQ